MTNTTPDAQPQRGWFATTHWSVVLSAGRGDDAGAQIALERLCEMYWPPLYSYIRRRGYSPENAQDLTQEFFVRLLQHRRIGVADPRKGRFRSFLLTALKNFMSDEWDKARAKKRGGGVPTLSLEFDTAEATYAMEPVENTTPEHIFERRWALTLLDNVVSSLRAEYERAGQADLFLALSPCIIGERSTQPYAELAAKLGTTESAIKSAVHRLRSRYRKLLRRDIANTVSNPDEIDDELNYLFAILARR